MSTTITELPTTPSTYRGDRGLHDSPYVIRLERCRYTRRGVRLGVGYIAPDGEGRQKHGGPMVPGPWAFTFPHCGVIDKYGGTGAEIARNEAAGLEREHQVGDLFRLDGRLYRLTDESRFAYPTLTLVEEEA